MARHDSSMATDVPHDQDETGEHLSRFGAQWRNDDAQLAQRLEDMAAQMQRTQRRAQAAFAAMCAAGPPSPPRKPLSTVN